MSGQDAFTFYNDVVEPLYAEFLTLNGNQKIETVDQFIEQGLKAVAAGNKSGIAAEDQQQAFTDAIVHLADAGLIAGRALANLRFEQASQIAKNKQKMKWCAQAPKEQVQKKWMEALEAYKRATTEDKKAATTQEKKAAIVLFRSCAKACSEWLKLFDDDLLSDYGAFRMNQEFRKQGAGFVVGIVTSSIVAIGAWMYLPPSAPPSGKDNVTITTPASKSPDNSSKLDRDNNP